MINAVFFHQGQTNNTTLRQKIADFYPRLRVTDSVFSPSNFLPVIQAQQPNLVFLEIEGGLSRHRTFFESLKNRGLEIILIASNRDYVFEAIHYRISGYLLKPLDTDSLKTTIGFALNRIVEKQKSVEVDYTVQPDKVIGIPTMEGYEFFVIDEIIRCESYLKCTRVVTQGRSDIISSYNIGQFSKALGKYGFYSPHQSHIINLGKVKKYLKEGTIVMEDNVAVPVARRKRNDFLDRVLHI